MVSAASVPNGAIVDVLQTRDVFAEIELQSSGAPLKGWVRTQYLTFLATDAEACCFAEFVLPSSEGTRVEPERKPLIFELPTTQRSQTLRSAVLVHRKDLNNPADMASWPDHGGNPDNAKGRDTKPCYTKVEGRLAEGMVPTDCVQPPTKKPKTTRYWHTYVDEYGAGSGQPDTQPGKFAEARPRHDPEVETLHDWPKQACGPSTFDAFRLTNVGTSAVHIHALRAYFYPSGKVTSTIEQILTPGTTFGDYPPDHPGSTNLQPARFGGGEWALQHGVLHADQLNEQGMYPKSVELGPYLDGVPEGVPALQSGSLRGGELLLDVPDSARNLYLELACGDTRFDVGRPYTEQRQSDGYYGSRGWAKLSITSMDGDSRFMWMENVPPAGVLACAIDVALLAHKPKQLKISSHNHATWLMGYRMLILE
jgi:hypothetical protein